jgi:prevent-host-death family protein
MRMRATEASRKFSELLSRVARGETIEVDRHGEIVAVVSPARRNLIPGRDLLELIRRLPTRDRDFARDVTHLRDSLQAPKDPWLS